LVSGIALLLWVSLKSVQLLSESSCPQEEPFRPSKHPELNKRYTDYLRSEEFQNAALKRFSGAIQRPTVSYDFMRGEGVVVDPKFHAPFLALHEHLKDSYPLIHSRIERHVVNEFSLLYVWKGSNPSLKPMMFMAHQDVVPVDPSTANEWHFDPFSGYVDGGKVWGRGACDTKMTLVSILEATEALLQVNYQPERTILISYGHDEEISGYNGIKQIVKFLQQELGIAEKGIEFILDEGMALSKLKSASNPGKEYLVAAVGVAEKGYMDVNITVTMKKGGHASIAPAHTGIGILAQIINQIENNPSKPDLKADNPVLTFCNCIAEHTDTFSEYQKYLLNKWEWLKPVLLNSFAADPFLKASTTTSQAVDVIQGGVKVNALPQFQYALMNMRIAPHETVEIVADRIKSIVAPVAESNHLELVTDIHSHQAAESIGTVYLSFNDALQPAPISSKNAFSFKRLSGVIKHIFGEDAIVTPSIMTANTDTKFVWTLSDNIYRFMPFIMDGSEGVHTVNENVKIESFIRTVQFYHELIRSFNE
jgi:Gly-Xaa carboxypeptidase